MDSTQDNKNEEKDVKNNIPSFKLNDPVTVLNTSLMTTSDNFTPSCNQDNSSLSFVILGKDSMDIQDAEAQASLLASYVDIRQKSMSIDYKSMISSMNAEEMQQRLTEILQENVKLKETLKQNNVFLMENFTKLMSWQEEVTKVHDSHKQKFAETKELIKHLKKENAELKTKLAHLQCTDSMGFEAINRSNSLTLSHASQAEELEQSLSKFGEITLKDCSYITSKQAEEEQPHNKLESNVEKESHATNKLSCSEIVTEIPESQTCSEACFAKDKKIVDLQKSVAILEQKLQCTFTPVQLPDLTNLSIPSRQKITQITKQYNNIVQELTECFTAQIERFNVIEQVLKESADVLTILDDSKLEVQLNDYKQKLCYCRQRLADEQVKIITDRQTLIKSQNQFHKMLSEYKSILYELELMINENAKLEILKDNTMRESLQISEKIERINLEERLLQEERSTFAQEKDILKEEKMLLEQQKQSLETERESFYNEKKLLAQEKIGLNEEKMSLDQQSYLYENSKQMLEQEKKLLTSRFQDLVDKADKMQQELERTNNQFAIALEQITQRTEEIVVLKSQLKLYEEDFDQERKLKESLLEEKNKLEKELQKQVEFNKQLQQKVNGPILRRHPNASNSFEDET
ncbi:golgin subfamily A member 6-like protein 4 isoform X2 [Pseudomyrmex gracilis]|uniref:golgin subfamily A member 6-like protein 4 isoform X2 n=1 Tax=Pseudomyrmex gracilis TaxID=219809 RepID=UPI00099592D9|nr:golgin subfamily A member 6-like protein 4 isoform X2 [Pseudomyrmex gracilis]